MFQLVLLITLILCVAPGFSGSILSSFLTFAEINDSRCSSNGLIHPNLMDMLGYAVAFSDGNNSTQVPIDSSVLQNFNSSLFTSIGYSVPDPNMTIYVPVYWHIICGETKERAQGCYNESLPKQWIKLVNDKFALGNIQFLDPLVETIYNDTWYTKTVQDGSKSGKEFRSLYFNQMADKTHRGGIDALNVWTANLTYQLKDGDMNGVRGHATYMPYNHAHGKFDELLELSNTELEFVDRPQDDGVLIDFRTFPETTYDPRYNQAQTLMHEIGHWTGLWHTFEGGCENRDWVVDTPPEASPNRACNLVDPYSTKRDTCPDSPGLDPIFNIMDYSPDYCMGNFSQGQMELSRWALWNIRMNQGKPLRRTRKLSTFFDLNP